MDIRSLLMAAAKVIPRLTTAWLDGIHVSLAYKIKLRTSIFTLNLITASCAVDVNDRLKLTDEGYLERREQNKHSPTRSVDGGEFMFATAEQDHRKESDRQNHVRELEVAP